MQEKNQAGLKEQRMRRNRVKRMKTTIMMAVGIWMIVSTVFCIGLIVKIINMDKKLNELAQNTISVQQLADSNGKVKSASEPQDIQTQNMDAGQNQGEPQQELTGGQAMPASGESADNAGQVPESGEPKNDNSVKEGVRQKVYLTFDDGPSENTAKILDILKEKGVKATFFVIGNESEEAKELYQRIVTEGHTLGMHSYSHKYSVVYESLDSFKADMDDLKSYVYEITGVEPKIMRFPGGSSNQVSNTDMKEFIQYLNEQGINYYDWNVASGDATSQAYTPEELVENVMQDVVKYDTSIVLMHDAATKGTTVEALGPMIDQLQAMNVELLPIDENTKPIQHIAADSVTE